MNNPAYGLLTMCAGLFLILAGCRDGPERPENLIPEEGYVDLLVELQLVNSFSQSQLADSVSVDSLLQEVFRKYEVSREAFSRSHRYYQEFPEQQKQRIDQAIERLRMDEVRDTTRLKRPTPSTDTARPPTQPSLP